MIAFVLGATLTADRTQAQTVPETHCVYAADCAGSSSSSSNDSSPTYYDYGAQQRAQEAAAAAEAERRRKEEQIEQQRRDAEEKRRQEEAEQQARFIADRDAVILRGSTNMRVTPNSSGATELRGSTIDTGIRDIKQANKTRDLGGKHAAWKQINCAAAISGYAFAALGNVDKPDYEEFRNLTGEALNALNGSQMGVECPKTPAVPAAYGSGGAERVAAQYKALIERGQKLAEDLGQTRAKRKVALDRLIEIKKAIADPREKSELEKLRAVKVKLDQQQDDKYAAVRDEQRKINAANMREAEELKKRAMAEALAAQRTAQGEYSKNTEHESRDLNELKKVKAEADAAGSFKAETRKKLEDLKL